MCDQPTAEDRIVDALTAEGCHSASARVYARISLKALAVPAPTGYTHRACGGRVHFEWKRSIGAFDAVCAEHGVLPNGAVQFGGAGA